MDIGLQQVTKHEIYQKLDPPFEDLFDPAEEYILTLLLIPWMKMVEQDKENYEKVELVEEMRQLDSVYFRKLQTLREQTLPKKEEWKQICEILRQPLCRVNPRIYELKSSTLIYSLEQVLPVKEDIPLQPSLLEVAQSSSEVFPKELKAYSIYDMLRKRLELEEFRVFLEQHSASTDLTCWIDIEQFRRMLHKNKDEREEKAKDIKNKYLNKKYFFGPNSPATKEEQARIMKSGGGWGQILHEQVPPLVLLEVQKHVQSRLEKKWLPLFYTSEEAEPLKKPKLHLKDAAEDILIQQEKFDKKTEPWKHVDNKWISSSREIITFRKALLNPIIAFQFQRYVSLKGDLLENGVLFWQEVQKYKDMCHSHCDDAIIQNKITTIINCFISSAIPPALRIDIPEDQAQKIIERRRELGPYVFREAQMTIFALLFKFWPDFCEFRINLANEKILPILENRKEKKLLKMKSSKEAEEKLKKDVQRKSTVSVKIGSVIQRKRSKGELSSTPSFTGYGRQLTWSYSKYIEALQQERVLLRIQEDLNKKSIASSAYMDLTALLALKSERPPEKITTTTLFSSAFVKQRPFPPKDNEKMPKL